MSDPKPEHTFRVGPDGLVPPVEMMFDGTTSIEEFEQVGEGFVRHFLIERSCLKPSERVLDVGCGIGQKARALSSYLDESGSYDGFDIVSEGIRWCDEHYSSLPHFTFKLADIYNTHYNRNGKRKAAEYKFPYDDAQFDVVFLSSVFTHLLPAEVSNYLGEVSRVLKPGGRCTITFFLLNNESKRRIDEGSNSIKFPYAHESKKCLLADENSPETTVAYDEEYIRGLYELHGLTIVEITYGFWCGRKELHGCLQDVMIAVKE